MKDNDKRPQFDFQHLAGKSRDMIYRLRLVPSRHYQFISPAVKDVLGYTPEECYADPDLILRTVHPDFQRNVESARKGKGTFNQYEELCAIHKDGKLVWLERLHIPIYEDGGTLVALEGISRDISERKESEDALRRTQESLLAAQEVAHFGSFERNLVTMEGGGRMRFIGFWGYRLRSWSPPLRIF